MRFGTALNLPAMTPGTPSSGYLLYPKSDGKWYTKDSTGGEAAIAGGAGGISDTGWVNLTLAGGWNNGLSAYGWPAVTAARKMGDFVYLQGLPTNASGLTTNRDDTIALLPVGMRPKTNLLMACHVAVGATEQESSIRIFATGAITCGTALPNGSWMSFNVPPFPVA